MVREEEDLTGGWWGGSRWRGGRRWRGMRWEGRKWWGERRWRGRRWWEGEKEVKREEVVRV